MVTAYTNREHIRSTKASSRHMMAHRVYVCTYVEPLDIMKVPENPADAPGNVSEKNKKKAKAGALGK